MKSLLLLTFLLLNTAWASDDCVVCVGSRNMDLVKVKDWGINDVTAHFGYETVDWTVDDAFQGSKVILKLSTKIGPEYETEEDEGGYLTRYVIGDTEITQGIGETGQEYSYLKFTAITKEEALKLKKGDGIRIINKTIEYGQFNLKKDLLIGEDLFASFEPVRSKAVMGVRATKKLQLELAGESAIGYSLVDSSNENYEDTSNFYLGLRGGFRVKHDNLGTVKFDYGINSGTVMWHATGATTREGNVRLSYEFDFNKNTKCSAHVEKRSYQNNPGFDEETGMKQDRIYETAKTFGVGCSGRFDL